MSNTSCKDCKFAQFNDLTQFNCQLNKLDKFKERGVLIVDAYDEEKEFYVVMGRRCPYFIKNTVNIDAPQVETLLRNNNFHLVYFADNSFDNLVRLIFDINNSIEKPARITVVRKLGNQLEAQTIARLLAQSLTIPWKLENILIDYPNDDKLIHEIVRGHKIPFYTILYAPTELPQNYFQSINNFVFNELYQFGMIEDNNIFTISLTVHEHIYYEECNLYNGENLSVLERLKSKQCQTEQKIIFNLQEVQQLITQKS